MEITIDIPDKIAAAIQKATPEDMTAKQFVITLLKGAIRQAIIDKAMIDAGKNKGNEVKDW